MRQLEAEHQAALFQWAKLMEGVHPELSRMFHVPNGGKRDRVTAAKLKAEGVKAGVPDIVLPVPRGSYHGLWIELKVDNGKPSKEQREWLDYLNASGYCALLCYGWQTAREEIELYLNLPTEKMAKEEING